MEPSALPLADPQRRLQPRAHGDLVLLVLDRAGCIREINRRGCEVLGFGAAELLGRDWFASCLPASARAAARTAFQRRLAGAQEPPRPDVGVVVARDGAMHTIRWHHALVRDAEGGVVGVVSAGEDVGDSNAAAELLERLAAGTASLVGESFLRRLARELVEALAGRCAFVGEADETAEHLRVLACWPHDDFLDSFVLPLDGSPLLPSLSQDVCTVESGASRRFAGDPLLAHYAAEGVLAVSLLAPRDGRLLGVLAVLYDRALGNQPLAEAVLRLFAMRAAAEIERLRSERALHAAKELAEVTLQSIGDAVLTTDPEGRVTEINPAAERLLGWCREETLGQPLGVVLQLFDEQTGERLPDPVEHCFRAGGPVALPPRTVLMARDGARRAVSDTAAPIRDRDGNVVGAVLVFQDVTEARRLAHTLAYRASHDMLTGLPNRGEFDRRLEAARDNAVREGVRHAVCYLDLDQFKVINDLCGHQAGDELLRRLAGVLQRQVRSSDLLARLGGDEFGVLLEGCPLERAQELAAAICRAVRDYRFTWGGKAFALGMSIGVVAVTGEAESAAWLLSRADLACYAAKDLGRNRVYVDRAGDPELVRRQLEMSRLSDLLAGLEEGRFELAFQPLVRLRGTSRLGKRGELLLRWRNDQDELVSAGAFIPAAERYGLMATLDSWVLREALTFFGRRFPRGEGLDGIGLNLSSNTLADDAFAERVKQALADTGMPPDRLWFEITETAAVNNLEQALALIGRLRALGCRFALDDFGSGLSSFRLLRSLPIDMLKVDGSFVRRMVEDGVDAAVVEATTRVARAMGIATVAEWVEQVDLLPRLRALGIDYAQGFAVGAPVPLATLAAPAARAARRPALRGGVAQTSASRPR